MLIQQRQVVSEDEWKAAQPQPYTGDDSSFKRGEEPSIDQASQRVPGALEGETLKVVDVTQGEIQHQAMQGFPQGKWSGNQQMFWTGGQPGAKLTLGLDVDQPGRYQVETVLTMAPDYGQVQLWLDDQPLGEPIDLYNYPDVITTGVLPLGTHELTKGPHRFTVEIKGSNPAAAQAFMFGLDYVRLVSP